MAHFPSSKSLAVPSDCMENMRHQRVKILQPIHVCRATPKTESMHQTRTFIGFSKKDIDIFRKCKM